MNRTAFLLVSCLISVRAAAADMAIADVSLHLPQPSGYCEMDPVLASDAPLVANTYSARAKAGGRLLLLSADCSEVKDWRGGKRRTLEHFAQYETPLRTEYASLPDIPGNVVRSYCEGMRRSEHAAGGMSANDLDRAEYFSKTLGQNETLYVGVVAEEPLVCYVATLRNVEAETGDGTQLCLVASTIIKEKVVLFYLFAPYRGRETLSRLLTMQRANMAQRSRPTAIRARSIAQPAKEIRAGHKSVLRVAAPPSKADNGLACGPCESQYAVPSWPRQGIKHGRAQIWFRRHLGDGSRPALRHRESGWRRRQAP